MDFLSCSQGESSWDTVEPNAINAQFIPIENIKQIRERVERALSGRDWSHSAQHSMLNDRSKFYRDVIMLHINIREQGQKKAEKAPEALAYWMNESMKKLYYAKKYPD